MLCLWVFLFYVVRLPAVLQNHPSFFVCIGKARGGWISETSKFWKMSARIEVVTTLHRSLKHLWPYNWDIYIYHEKTNNTIKIILDKHFKLKKYKLSESKQNVTGKVELRSTTWTTTKTVCSYENVGQKFSYNFRHKNAENTELCRKCIGIALMYDYFKSQKLAIS